MDTDQTFRCDIGISGHWDENEESTTRGEETRGLQTAPLNGASSKRVRERKFEKQVESGPRVCHHAKVTSQKGRVSIAHYGKVGTTI